MLLLTPGITETDLQSLYADSYIQRVGHDHRQASPVIHPLAQYLTCRIDGVFAGAFLAIRTSHLEIELHSLLLRSAIDHSRQLGRACLDWAFSDLDIQRASAPVSSMLRSVVNYCTKIGFQVEGVKRRAIQCDGTIYDVVLMGMTRQQYEASRG